MQRAIGIALLVLALGSTATAAVPEHFLHGTKCVTDSRYGGIQYGPQYGPYNNASSGGRQLLWCSLDLQDVSTLDYVYSLTVNVTDRNENSGQDVTCSVWTMNADGSGGMVSVLSTSSWSQSVLGLAFGNFYLTYGTFVDVQCYLPIYSGNHGYSNLVSIDLQYPGL